MRSGVGFSCPRSRRLECLLDFFPRAALPAGLAEALDGVLLAALDAAPTLVPAAKSSAKPAKSTLLSFIQPRLDIDIASSFEPAIELLFGFRRYYTRQEYGKGAIAVASPENLENHVHSRFELGHRAFIVLHGADRFVVDFRDDVAAIELQVVRKAGRIDLRHQNTSLPFHAHTGSAV